jgi:hypothetical protein
MFVDCEKCVVRGPACGSCLVTVLIGPPPGVVPLDGLVERDGGVEFDEEELRALDVLADAGLVPRLRLIPVRSLDHRRAA